MIVGFLSATPIYNLQCFIYTLLPTDTGPWVFALCANLDFYYLITTIYMREGHTFILVWRKAIFFVDLSLYITSPRGAFPRNKYDSRTGHARVKVKPVSVREQMLAPVNICGVS